MFNSLSYYSLIAYICCVFLIPGCVFSEILLLTDFFSLSFHSILLTISRKWHLPYCLLLDLFDITVFCDAS